MGACWMPWASSFCRIARYTARWLTAPQWSYSTRTVTPASARSASASKKSSVTSSRPMM